ncbi:sugar transferase [Gilvibacter sediminis]|uniref:sugar transferase n=1 Tax=Gilvibacter sediminis TaxID=379071 RepID=UPI00234FFFE3|nr:sugar transferase [Gilvibacter sediminis]MDC7999137.1 sugar transferase [Gilvibacter sediminis]
MSPANKFIKRVFDLLVSTIGLVLFGWLILICAVLARLDTGLSGFFKQTRVGKDAKLFKVYKLRSMRNIEGVTTTVSTSKDPRITKMGAFWRKSKLDELPQLINVFKGEMSFVGPRPDVPGFMDKLEGEDRVLLDIRPGITGPASIYFKDEEALLAAQDDPEKYNAEVIWPKKVELNKEYIENYSIFKDIGYIIKTVL